MRAVFARPVCVRRALVAIVVACETRATCSALSRYRLRASRIAKLGCLGTVRTLTISGVFLDPLSKTMLSVNVPPTSIPTKSIGARPSGLMTRQRVGDGDTYEGYLLT